MQSYSVFTAGKKEKQDAFVTYKPCNTPLHVSIISPVEMLFGEQQRKVVSETLKKLTVEQGELLVEDYQALDFTLEARIIAVMLLAAEAGYSNGIETEEQLVKSLCSEVSWNLSLAAGSPIYRSALYTPGNTPKMLVQCGQYGADAIVLDLEDSIAVSQKTEARILINRFFCRIKPALASDKESDFIVRINDLQSPLWQEDLQWVLASGCSRIRVPKVESLDEINKLIEFLSQWEYAHGYPPEAIRLECILETPSGVELAYALAAVSARIEALCFGAEDYCTALGIERTGPAFPLDYAKSRIAAAAAHAGIVCYDSVWSVIDDISGLEADAERGRLLGFQGKAAIHPGQIASLQRIYSWSEQQIAAAEAIIQSAESTADGVVRDKAGRMIDKPVLKRAQKIVQSIQ